MSIGASIFLIALGAILAFAVSPGLIPFIDQTLVGYILMGVGVLGLVVSLVMMGSRPRRRVSESRQVIDPDTGETVTRRDTRDM
jgi:membrane protein implicated in regulation of membrane protease activity